MDSISPPCRSNLANLPMALTVDSPQRFSLDGIDSVPLLSTLQMLQILMLCVAPKSSSLSSRSSSSSPSSSSGSYFVGRLARFALFRLLFTELPAKTAALPGVVSPGTGPIPPKRSHAPNRTPWEHFLCVFFFSRKFSSSPEPRHFLHLPQQKTQNLRLVLLPPASKNNAHGWFPARSERDDVNRTPRELF